MQPRARVAAETLVVVSAATEGMIFFVWTQREAAGVPMPRGMRILSTGFGPTSVTRPDAVPLRVSPEGGFFASEMHRLMRSPSQRFHANDVIDLSDTRATVVALTQRSRVDAGVGLDGHFNYFGIQGKRPGNGPRPVGGAADPVEVAEP